MLQRILQKKQSLDSLRPLPQSALKRLRKELALEWTYNTNAIEGNTLSLHETRMVLEEGITVKGKSLREHFEAKNHLGAIAYLEKQLNQPAQPLTPATILDIHKLVLAGIEEDFAGRYRNGIVRIVGANFVPPNPLKVPTLIGELVEWNKQATANKNIIERVSYLHHRFVWIHPFFDGNGRTARLLMNLELMRQGYPPAIILKNDRQKYYAALNNANQGSYQKLELLVGQAIERSLDLTLEAVAFQPDGEYISLTALAAHPECPYGQEYLSLLARRGHIDAFKQGRNWVSSLSALRTYLKNKPQHHA